MRPLSSRKNCEGLLQTWITYRRDLNEAEQTNIGCGHGMGLARSPT